MLACVQAKNVPRDLGSVFSTAVTPSDVDRLELWLLRERFELVTESKKGRPPGATSCRDRLHHVI
jgi:hypothetical protein